MAVGNEPLPNFIPIKGVEIGTANAGIKQTERDDVTVFRLSEKAVTAGVFTKNAFCAAPVHICKEHLSQSNPRYLLVNTGNANAGTGEPGFQASRQTVSALSELANVNHSEVLPFSTGVIGEVLPAGLVNTALPKALANLSSEHWTQAAVAIMTTDTRPKGFSRQIELAGKKLTLSGISKGSGMIKPNMATMLAYVAFDAKSSQSTLQSILDEANALSFNSITVDGDTSTNDSAMLIATGEGELDIDDLSSDDKEKLQQLVNEAFITLAQLIVKDGEGATKFVSVSVSGGGSLEDCRKVAFTVAESPLVKTALFASDANWGRILAAVGRSNAEALKVDKVELKINDVLIAENGGRASSYTEEAGTKAMAEENIHIDINLNMGNSQATVWTSDLSHEYVTINAEYRT